MVLCQDDKTKNFVRLPNCPRTILVCSIDANSRKGRLWQDPWELTDDDWGSGKAYDDLPDWTEELCSRVSLERVKVFPGE